MRAIASLYVSFLPCHQRQSKHVWFPRFENSCALWVDATLDLSIAQPLPTPAAPHPFSQGSLESPLYYLSLPKKTFFSCLGELLVGCCQDRRQFSKHRPRS